MRKIVKVSLIIATICLSLGIIIAIAVTSSAGYAAVRTNVGNHIFNIFNNSFGWNWNWHWNGSDGWGNDWDDEDFTGHTVYSGSHTDNQAALGSDIHNLTLSIGGCHLEIRESEDEYIKISTRSFGRYTYYTQGDTFVIRGGHKTSFTTEKMYLYLPKGITYDAIVMEFGGCSVDIGALQADNIYMEVGAGKIVWKAPKADSLDVIVGAGEINIFDADVNTLNVEAGAGRITFTGKTSGDISAECAMGSITMKLEGKETDYNYDVECSMGSYSIGHNSSKGGFAVSKYDNNNAAKELYIECAMGSVNIDFN